MVRLCVGFCALLMCASVALAGPEWVEDQLGQGDAGPNAGGAQVTMGIGSLRSISGRITGVGARGEGDPNDFEDLYLVDIINPNAFSASLAAFFEGSADFDARIYLFKIEFNDRGEIEAFGVLANDDTRFVAPRYDPSASPDGLPTEDSNGTIGGARRPGGDSGGDSGTRGDYKDPEPEPDPSPLPMPQFSSGPTIRSSATDGSGATVGTGLHIIAVSYSPNECFSGGQRGEGTGDLIFDIQDPFEVSGPDGPGGQGALAGWTRPEPRGGEYFGPGQTGTYHIALQGVGFAVPPTTQGTGGPADRMTSTEKGSILIWSKVEVRWGTGNNIIQDTFLTLTNDWLGTVRVQLYFVNGDPPLAADGAERAHPGWNWIGDEVTLTADQPVYWSAATGRSSMGIFDPTLSPWTVLDPGNPPGRPANDGTGDRVLRGFIIGWAVDINDQELRWNHLAGTGTLVHYINGSAWTYSTWASQSVNPAVAHGEPTGTPGILNLDGTEFSRPYEELLMNFQAVNSTAFSGPRLVRADTDLTLHPVSTDLRQETSGPVTTKAHFLVWNQNEVKMSGQYRCITCWDQQLLSLYDLPNHFDVGTLHTNFGKARIDGIASQLCDLDLYGVGGPGTTPDGVIDVFSQPAALLGVMATHLNFDNGAAFDAAGTNLFGLGVESAVIRADRVVIPPELQEPELSPFSDSDPGDDGRRPSGKH